MGGAGYEGEDHPHHPLDILQFLQRGSPEASPDRGGVVFTLPGRHHNTGGQGSYRYQRYPAGGTHIQVSVGGR